MVARKHHAQTSSIEVEVIRVRTAREGVVHEHDRPLESLEAIAGLDQDLGERSREAFHNGAHLGDMAADHADHLGRQGLFPPIIYKMGSSLEESLDQGDDGIGEIAVGLPGDAGGQLYLDYARPSLRPIDRTIQWRYAGNSGGESSCSRCTERRKREVSVEGRLDNGHRVRD